MLNGYAEGNSGDVRHSFFGDFKALYKIVFADWLRL